MVDAATFQALARDLRRHSAAREWDLLQATDALFRRAWRHAPAPDARDARLAQAIGDARVAHDQAYLLSQRAASEARGQLARLGHWRDGALGYLRMHDDR